LKKLAEFDCFVGTMSGKLHSCRMLKDGWPEFSAGRVNWTEVRLPVASEFLNAANAALGTSYHLGDASAIVHRENFARVIRGDLKGKSGEFIPSA
jgi:hypothetical protein